MTLATRYLTPAAKAQELALWQATKATPRPPGDLAGRGYPDPEIVPLVDALNELPGLCTLQSCSGHPEGSREPGPGHLWLWLDRETSAAFDERAFELAKLSVVDSVSKLYQQWGQEVTVIVFRGSDSGLLADSMRELLKFFEKLTNGSYRHSA